MGKGTINSHLGNGEYSITVNYNREYYEAQIAKLDKNIVDLQAKLYTTIFPSDPEYGVTKLQIAALQKQKEAFKNSFPDDKSVNAWCADLTENLSGEVTTIEIPGESTNIQIAPGDADGATYNAANDGQLVPAIGQDSAGWFYNLAMLPGWQKWKPTFRYGTISNIDAGEHTCNVALEEAKSTQQDLNVNQSTSLSNVPIEYMDCNSAAFEDGDTVLVMFESQDWTKPKVIGFKEEPKPCKAGYLFISISKSLYNYVIVWDLENDQFAENIPTNSGGVASFPCLYGEISGWLYSQDSFYHRAVARNTEVAYANSNAYLNFFNMSYDTDIPTVDQSACTPLGSNPYPKICLCVKLTQSGPAADEFISVGDYDMPITDSLIESNAYEARVYYGEFNFSLISQWGLKYNQTISTEYQQVIEAINNSGATTALTTKSEYFKDYEMCHYWDQAASCGQFTKGVTSTEGQIHSTIEGSIFPCPSLTYQYDEYGHYNPGIGACDVLAETNVNAWDIAIKESVYGTVDLPYVVTIFFKEVKNKTVYTNMADWTYSYIGKQCKGSDGQCKKWPNSLCNIDMPPEYKEIVPPEFSVYVNKVDGDPINGNPFTGALDGNITNAMNDAVTMLISKFDDDYFDEILVKPYIQAYFLI